MNARRTVLIGLCLVMLLQLLGGTVPTSAAGLMPEDKAPGRGADNAVFMPLVFRDSGRVDNTARWLTDDLTQQGYAVASGYAWLYTQDDCTYSYAVLHSCLGNNPAAPYVIPIMPSWPDEWVDPATANMVGPTEEGYSASYRLDPGEAIVIIAQLPPPARYLGLQTYLMSRPGEWDTESDQYKFVTNNLPALVNTFFTKLPNNQERVQLFADLSDPINNVVIERGSGAVWDQVRYFIITSDATMESAVRAALIELGIPDNFVFTEQIPAQLSGTDMAFGLNEGDDDFLTVLRYAMPDDGGGDDARSTAWREELPLAVLRIRDTRPEHQPQPYAWVDFEARSATDPPEINLKPELDALAEAVCDGWGQSSCDRAGLLNMKASPLSLTGPACVAVGMNCLAPNEDATYFLSSRLPLPDDRVYAMVGALSTETNNATYVGVGLNSSLTQLGFANIDDDQLVDTAAVYDDSGRFFLQYFARDCSDIDALTAGSQCYSIGDQLPYCTDPSDLSCSMLALTLRGYLFPSTQRGAASASVLNPQVIPLQKPGPD
ncbi:MAG: hypothetical protein R2854_06230 [Caldilineaceae bacterium]